MSARLLALMLSLAAALALLSTLGVRWHLDRTRAFDPPRLDPARQFRLADDPRREPHLERWVVALHPGCPHCLASLARVAERRAERDAPVRLGGLIVDRRTTPDPAYWQALPLEEVWWDSAGDWRARWGHRVYGEVLCFDRRGRHLRTLPPFEGEPSEAALFPSPRH